MILKFYQFWFEPPPTLIATLQLANRNASTRQSWHASTYQSLLTTRLLSPRTHANNSTPLFTNPRRRLQRFTFRLQHFTFGALTFHLLSSNISPSELRRFTVFAPTCQAEKPPRFGKGCRNRHLPMVMAKRFDSFFFSFLFFPWFVHFSHFGLWNIFDSAIWITWKTKKVKHYQRRVTVWALKPMKKFDCFNCCSLSTTANNRF